MTEDGRLIRTDPVAMGVWKRLTAQFATWRLIVFASFTKRALNMIANDQLSILNEATHWKIGLGLLGGLNDDQVDFLLAYARINARKVDRLFRATALIFVSIPVAGIFGLTELDPEIWDRLGFEQSETLIVVLGAWMALAGLMMAAAWRAQELADLIEFEQARRQFDAAKQAKAPAE
ncbi:hypothetical protein [Maricaulis alexandrii]|uniref:hypothetical protein n=1 Tax=Maricaulis alexandrii TaxID=2570354 RepID=UPI001109270A|nr:hypothetical protein [Maricaulis alexandrii]